MTASKVKAFKEACADTFIAALINIPLNFALMNLCFYLELSALTSSLLITFVFTVWALVRKTYIRVFFELRYKGKPND